jgi:hypothetical protein
MAGHGGERDLALLLFLLLLIVRLVGLTGVICGDSALPCFFLCPAAEARGEEGVERWSCLDGAGSFFRGS